MAVLDDHLLQHFAQGLQLGAGLAALVDELGVVAELLAPDDRHHRLDVLGHLVPPRRQLLVGLHLVRREHDDAVLVDFVGQVLEHVLLEAANKAVGDALADGVDVVVAGNLAVEVGVGMLQNPKYNEGRPYFIAFRPTLHEPHKISDVELETYKEYASLLDIIESHIETIEKTGKDVFELKTEFKLAKDKLKKGRFRMAKIYIDSLRKQLNIGEENTRRE